MATTTNLHLNVTADDSVNFKAWCETVNGESANSNMQKIDAFAGHIYGVSGTFTISTNSWNNGTVNVSVEDLGENDALLINGATANDQDKIGTAGLFATATTNSVTFQAKTVPNESITLNYFIVRGK